MDKEILNIHEVCELLGVKERTMYSLLKAKQIPAIKVGGQWRFHREMILNMFHKEHLPTGPESESSEGTGE